MQEFISILFILLPGIIGFILRLRGIREIPAWLFSCTVLPILILLDEFLIPYHGGGASMWPIALAVGSFYGAITGGFGVVIASYYLKRKRKRQSLKKTNITNGSDAQKTRVSPARWFKNL